jgi:hypothetical protein
LATGNQPNYVACELEYIWNFSSRVVSTGVALLLWPISYSILFKEMPEMTDFACAG